MCEVVLDKPRVSESLCVEVQGYKYDGALMELPFLKSPFGSYAHLSVPRPPRGATPGICQLGTHISDL